MNPGHVWVAVVISYCNAIIGRGRFVKSKREDHTYWVVESWDLYRVVHTSTLVQKLRCHKYSESTAARINFTRNSFDSCSWKSTSRLKMHIQISTGILEIGELRLDDVEKGSKIWNCLPKIGCNCTIHVWWVKSWKLHLAKVLRFLWLQSGQKRDLKGHADFKISLVAY